MPSYAAYGLVIDSEIPLPELPAADRPADIVIRLGAVARGAAPQTEGDDYVPLGRDSLCFHTPHGGFRITAARELTVDPSPGITPSTLRLVILGRALGALLQWRGLFVLHASAVARDGRVTIFAGASGAGKSTAAAAHMARGDELVADDLVAIDLDGAAPCVLPAYPQMKLWPDAAAALGIGLEPLERVHAAHEKRMVALDATRLAAESLPMEAIIILADGAPARLERLDRQEALVELLRHAYAPRLMRVLGRQADHMAQCAQLAGSIALWRASVDRAGSAGPDIGAIVAMLGATRDG